MGRTEARADFSGALSAIIVVALIVATTAVMVVTLNTAGAAGERVVGPCNIAETADPCEARASGLISLSLLAK